MIWPTSMEMLGAAFTGSAIGRRARGELALAFGAVAVELDMRQVQRQAVGGAHGGERRLDVAGDAEVAGVHVQRMGDTELEQPRAPASAGCRAA